VYYEDAGDGFGYEKGDYCRRTISFKPAEKSIVLSKQEGSFASAFKKIQLVLHGFDDTINEVTVNSIRIRTANAPVKILDGLEHVSAYYDRNYVKSLRDAEPVSNQKTIVVDNSANDITILLP
jgi:alpha-glucosidase